MHRLAQDGTHPTSRSSQRSSHQVRFWHYKGLWQKASQSVKWSHLIFCLTACTSVAVSSAFTLQKALASETSSSSPYHCKMPSFTTTCCCHFSGVSSCCIIYYSSVHPRHFKMGYLDISSFGSDGCLWLRTCISPKRHDYWPVASPKLLCIKEHSLSILCHFSYLERSWGAGIRRCHDLVLVAVFSLTTPTALPQLCRGS